MLSSVSNTYTFYIIIGVMFLALLFGVTVVVSKLQFHRIHAVYLGKDSACESNECSVAFRTYYIYQYVIEGITYTKYLSSLPKGLAEGAEIPIYVNRKYADCAKLTKVDTWKYSLLRNAVVMFVGFFIGYLVGNLLSKMFLYFFI